MAKSTSSLSLSLFWAEDPVRSRNVGLDVSRFKVQGNDSLHVYMEHTMIHNMTMVKLVSKLKYTG